MADIKAVIELEAKTQQGTKKVADSFKNIETGAAHIQNQFDKAFGSVKSFGSQLLGLRRSGSGLEFVEKKTYSIVKKTEQINKNFSNVTERIKKNTATTLDANAAYEETIKQLEELKNKIPEISFESQEEQLKIIVSETEAMLKNLEGVKTKDAKKLRQDLKNSHDYAKQTLETLKKVERIQLTQRTSLMRRPGGKGMMAGMMGSKDTTAAQGTEMGEQAAQKVSGTIQKALSAGGPYGKAIAIALGTTTAAIAGISMVGKMGAQKIGMQQQSARVVGGMTTEALMGMSPAQINAMQATIAKEIGSKGIKNIPSEAEIYTSGGKMKGSGGVIAQTKSLYDKFGMSMETSTPKLAKLQKYGVTELNTLYGGAKAAGVDDARMGMFFDEVTEGFISAVESGAGTSFKDIVGVSSALMGMGDKWQGARTQRVTGAFAGAFKGASTLQGGVQQGMLVQAIMRQAAAKNEKMTLWGAQEQLAEGATPSNITAAYNLSKQMGGEGEAGKQIFKTMISGLSPEDVNEIFKNMQGKWAGAMPEGTKVSDANITEKYKTIYDKDEKVVGYDKLQKAIEEIQHSPAVLEKAFTAYSQVTTAMLEKMVGFSNVAIETGDALFKVATRLDDVVYMLAQDLKLIARNPNRDPVQPRKMGSERGITDIPVQKIEIQSPSGSGSPFDTNGMIIRDAQ